MENKTAIDTFRRLILRNCPEDELKDKLEKFKENTREVLFEKNQRYHYAKDNQACLTQCMKTKDLFDFHIMIGSYHCRFKCVYNRNNNLEKGDFIICKKIKQAIGEIK